VANAVSITPSELGFIGTLTSDAQTQLNAKATDTLVVHLAGTETITGAKTFTADTAIDTPTGNLLFRSTAVSGYIALIADTTPILANVIFRVQNVSGTDKFSIVPTLTQFSNNPVTITAVGALNATASTFINFASTTSSAYASTTTMAITGGSTATISGNGAVSDAINIQATSASGGIKMKINSVEKEAVTSTATTITNTDVNITATSIVNSGDMYSANYYRIGTKATNDPILSFKLMGTAETTTAAGTICWEGTYASDHVNNPEQWFVFPVDVVIHTSVLMFDIDQTNSGTMTLTFKTKTTNAGTVSTKRTQAVTWDSNTTISYAKYEPMTGTVAVNTYNQGSFINLSYTGGPPSNEWSIILFGYQI
jgi:hypothetical protein